MIDSPLESELSASWDANANAWTGAVRAGNIRSRRVATDAAIVDAVMQFNPRRALDVGCGEGWLARALDERGVETVGVDGSAALIDAAKAAGGGTFFVLSYDALVDDPTRLPGPYDVIVCNFALLSEDLVPLLRALATALAPTGHLVIQTVHPWIACGDAPYVDGWREERFAAFGEDNWKPMPWHFRTFHSWLATLREASYQDVQVREPLDPDTLHPLSLILMAAK